MKRISLILAIVLFSGCTSSRKCSVETRTPDVWDSKPTQSVTVKMEFKI